MFPGIQKLILAKITMKHEAMVHDKMYDFSIFFSAENAGELKYMIFSELLIDA